MNNAYIASDNTDEMWNACGISWDHTPVATNNGATQLHGTTQLMVVVDHEKFIATFGLAPLMFGVNNTSVRVTGQRVNRALLPKRATESELRHAVVSAVTHTSGRTSSVITKTVTITVTIRTLPDGATYNGTDEVEYRQLVIAAYIDMGLDIGMARMLGEKAVW